MRWMLWNKTSYNSQSIHIPLHFSLTSSKRILKSLHTYKLAQSNMLWYNTAQLHIFAFKCGKIYIRLLLTCIMTYLVSDKKRRRKDYKVTAWVLRKPTETFTLLKFILWTIKPDRIQPLDYAHNHKLEYKPNVHVNHWIVEVYKHIIHAAHLKT